MLKRATEAAIIAARLPPSVVPVEVVVANPRPRKRQKKNHHDVNDFMGGLDDCFEASDDDECVVVDGAADPAVDAAVASDNRLKATIKQEMAVYKVCRCL